MKMSKGDSVPEKCYTTNCGAVPGALGEVILPRIGEHLGEVCTENHDGRCTKIDCKLNHPPHQLRMTASAATTCMRNVSELPMGPLASAKIPAQAILQAHTDQHAQPQSKNDSSATELAAARAAEISQELKVEGVEIEETEIKEKVRSLSPRAMSNSRSRSLINSRSRSRLPSPHARSNSRSRSPISSHSRSRSSSSSPPSRYQSMIMTVQEVARRCGMSQEEAIEVVLKENHDDEKFLHVERPLMLLDHLLIIL